METNKHLCSCGKLAVWLYMPGGSSDNPFYCEDCVDRGCSCNEHPIVDEHYHPPGGVHPTTDDGIEGRDWIWVDEEKTRWTHVDEMGRKYPCCEYDHDKDGYDIDDSDDEYLLAKSGEGRD